MKEPSPIAALKNVPKDQIIRSGDKAEKVPAQNGPVSENIAGVNAPEKPDIRRTGDRRQAERRQKGDKKAGLRVIDRRTWKQTRSDRRTVVRLPEQVPLLISPEDEIFREFKECAIDISSQGLRVRSKREFSIGSNLNLCLYPPDLFVPIQLKGKVLWRKYDSKTKTFSYGLSFKDPTPEYQKLLDEFLGQQRLPGNRRSLGKKTSSFFYKQILPKLFGLSLIGQRAVAGRSDSGCTFDHIYSNKAKGTGVIGKFVDHILLMLPAAKASRFRKDLIKEAVQHEIKVNMNDGQKTRIADLGSGTARYLDESVGAAEGNFVEVLCLDRDKESIQNGKRIFVGRPFRFLRFDIFRTKRLLKISAKSGWKPNLVIVSGLIYYFSDPKVKAILSQIYEWLEPNGLLIVTNMIQNPNKKLIGNLFITQGGDAWIPLARPSHLVREWLDDAGFHDVHHVKDPWNMYSIFSARKDKESIDVSGFEFPMEGSVMRGKMYKPTNSKKLNGVILFVPGLGYTFSTYRLNPSVFCSQGFALAMYNMASHANSTGEWTLESSINGVSRAVDQLLEQFGRKIPVYVFAHSTGGLIAILGSMRDRRVRGVSIVNLVTSVTDAYLYWHQSGYNQKVKEYFKINEVVPPIIDHFLDDVNVMKSYQAHELPWLDLEFPYRYGLLKASSFASLAHAICFSPDLMKAANKIGFPILLFSGASDEVIPVSKTDQFAGLLRAPHEVIKTDSKNHFQSDYWGVIQAKTIDFFKGLTEK